MPTTSPPILIWQPGGGVPVGPVSNPPVYSQHGTTPLIEGQAYVDVVFESIQTTDAWVLVECIVVNEIDVTPLNIWPGIITDKSAAGFRLQLNGLPDSSNYYLHWAVSGINIPPTPATTFILSGPASGAVGLPSTFTVHLPSSTTGTATITPSDGGGGGTFSPTSVTLNTGAPPATFTYTPVTAGTKTISVTNTGGLLNPADLSFLAVVYATGYSMSGPSAGDVGAASTAFTVTLTPIGDPVPATVTVTPSDSSGGGTFTPTTVALSTGTPSAVFTYTAASAGTKTISVTNNGGLTDPGNISYVATVPPFTPASIAGLTLWFKADSLALADGAAVSTWADSSVSGNNATQTGANRPIYKTSIVNGKPVVRFDGVNDYMPLTTEITTPTNEFTVLAVYQTSGDNCFIGGASTVDQAIRVGQGGSNVLSVNVSPSGSGTSGPLGIARTSWNIGCVRLANPGVGTLTFYDSTGLVGSGAGITFTSKVGVIGAVYLPGTALYVAGDVAEIIYYNVAINIGTDLANVIAYLKTKYGIP